MNSFSWTVFYLLCAHIHTHAVAKWSRCQHIVLDLSMADGDMVFGRVQLFGVGYWSWWWASFWKPLCQMVDRFNELGTSPVFLPGMAGSDNRHTRLDDRSRCVRYLFWIFTCFFFNAWILSANAKLMPIFIVVPQECNVRWRRVSYDMLIGS